MSDVPQWVWPLLSLVAAGVGSWGAVRISVARLEVQMAQALKDIERNTRELAQHNEDLMVHDTEIDLALAKIAIPRVRRQPLRGWER